MLLGKALITEYLISPASFMFLSFLPSTHPSYLPSFHPSIHPSKWQIFIQCLVCYRHCSRCCRYSMNSWSFRTYTCVTNSSPNVPHNCMTLCKLFILLKMPFTLLCLPRKFLCPISASLNTTFPGRPLLTSRGRAVALAYDPFISFLWYFFPQPWHFNCVHVFLPFKLGSILRLGPYVAKNYLAECLARMETL